VGKKGAREGHGFNLLKKKIFDNGGEEILLVSNIGKKIQTLNGNGGPETSPLFKIGKS